MATPAFNESVSRLAQYRPFSDEGREMAAALADLVVGAAALEGGAFPSLGACQDAVRTLWGLELEMVEIRDVVAELEEQGRCLRDKGGFALSESEREAKEAAVAQTAALERQALDEWRLTVFALEPRLSDEDFQLLCQDLWAFLGRVIARHGVEAALILYPENPRAHRLFAELEGLGLSFLPKRAGFLDATRDRAFQLLVRQPTEAQRLFLANLLNTSFYVTVLTLDPAASQLIQDHVAGHRVYLDTNFLYSVLGLSKATEVLAANRLLDLTRDLGYELAVTPWTIRELRTSLDSAKSRVTRRPLPRRELADLMVKADSDMGSFVKAFWISYRDRGTQPKDFFEYFAHIERLLESHNVRVVDQGCTAVDQGLASIGEQLVLLERFIGWRGREEPVKEHDVKHRLLIERLRGGGHIRFSNARYWFLTQDSKLPRYGASTLDEGRVDLPFCVSTSAWAQIVRAFTPRTADYDQTIVDLLATPYVRYRGALSPRVVEQVVGRVDQFEGADARLASEVLADTALMRDIAQAESEEERTEKIQDAFILKAKELFAQLDEVAERELEMRKNAADFADAAEVERVRRETVENALTRERAAREESERLLSERLDEERLDRERDAERAGAAIEQERQQRAGMEAMLGQQIEDLKKWFRRGAAAVLGTIGIAVVVVAIAWDRIDGALAKSMAIASGALIVAAALILAFGARRGGRLVALAFAIVGFVGTIYTFVDGVMRD